MQISQDTQIAFDSNKKYFQTPIQLFQYFDKFSRWIPELSRRETWPETIHRVMDFFKRNTKTDLSALEWNDIETSILRMDVIPSMRIIQMAGPALERDHVGSYNCAAVAIDKISAFAEFLYVLMQGTGVGCSVEDRYVSRLPRIKKQKRGVTIQKWSIPDTTEGWCSALDTGMHTWFSGRDIEFDYSQIRPAGAVLKTKGGRASGPQPLKDLLCFVRSTILNAQGRKLTPLNCHDICCYCGFIVQVGGVRRAAIISLSDFEDTEIATCKNGEFWNRFPYRAMANNSAVHEEKPSTVDFMEEWLNLAKSGTGERGIFNRACSTAPRRKNAEFLSNPCCEILLRSAQFCNLSAAVARPDDTLDTLSYKVRTAAILGTIQATLTKFPYLSAQWKDNCEEERLLGVDITGQRDCKLLQSGNAAQIFTHLRDVAIETNNLYAHRFGINQATAVTCVKPSGDSSQLLNCSSGLHVRYAPYYIRRVRTGALSPVGKLLKDSGVPYFPETGQDANNPSILVFEFPVKSPDDAICSKDVTAKDQFEYWLLNKQNYTEHNPSCTISVEDSEWLSLGSLVYEHWDNVGGLSFIPKDNHIYPLAPYQEITEDEYKRRVREFPEINYARLVEYETADQTNRTLDYACTAGVCER